jgi:thioredoxin reductase
MVPRIDLARSLGATADPVRGVQVDAMGRTDVPGLFAVGDLAPQVPQVSVAIAAGAVSAAAVIKDAMGEPAAG